MSERQTTGEFINYRIGERSGKTYNKIQEMAKEIVRLQKENEELKEMFKQERDDFNKVYRENKRISKKYQELLSKK